MKIITTVGISLFNNYMRQEVKKVFDEQKHCKKVEYTSINNKTDNLKNRSSEEFFPDDEDCNEIGEIIKKKWLRNIHKINKDNELIWEIESDVINKDASAEIKSIFKICEEQKSSEKIEIYFITADTILSKMAAEIIKDELSSMMQEKNIVELKIFPIKGWQVNEAKEFIDNGLDNFYKRIKDLIEKDKGKDRKGNFKENIFINNSDVILNVSGGYKSILPYVTILGQIYNISIKYIYEESDSILTFENIPLAFDSIFEELYYPYLYKPDKLKNGEIKETLKKYGLIKENGKIIERSELGNIFKDYIFYNYADSKNVVGFYMEYKFYEYYIENIEKFSDKKFKNIKRSDKDTYDKEIDLLINFEDSKLAVECKSINALLGKNFEKLKEQISEQIDRFKRIKNCTPKEYHLCLYKFKLINNTRYSDDIVLNSSKKDVNLSNEFKSNLNEIKDELFNGTDIKFKVYLATLEYILNNESHKNYLNYYQKFMTNPLTDVKEVELKEIK
ncbi:hypothetical protein DVV81_07370 [Clostridium botulinum]|uniref:hypothetical protein n=1 Tax=Clostridium botulinum TaxID=1491 RepID=UPI0013F73437|nr:hypothetical protein [Clostridium botulinum]MBN1070990.1 hypothetical protein [Clostridium botulinum]NFO13625.1 hypothetical protein [Clostridium botulinum]